MDHAIHACMDLPTLIEHAHCVPINIISKIINAMFAPSIV